MTTFNHLADFKSSEGYWHDLEIFKPTIAAIYESINPKSILEIGFNIGWSATMWLGEDPSGEASLVAVDIGYHSDTINAATAMSNTFPDRFEFILADSKQAKKQLEQYTFDMVFVDGDHAYQGVMEDIKMCVELNIQYLIFDDYHKTDTANSGINGVKKACEDSENISLVKIYDVDGIPSQVAVYKNDLFYTT